MGKTWKKELPYFSLKDLACKKTKTVLLDMRFAVTLIALRVKVAHAMTLNSTCRTPAHNKRVKGHRYSLHLTKNPKHATKGCMATDVYWRSWSYDKKLRFVRVAWKAGWSLGLHTGFCHIDRRVDVGLPQHIFKYAGWSNVFPIWKIKR